MTRRPKSATRQHGSKLFVVDRRERGIVVLAADDDTTVEVRAGMLPATCRSEGAVLRVPVDANGHPNWNDATRDRAEEARRIAELETRAARLRQSDPGGDVVL